MTCRHGPGDPDCSSNGGGWVREAAAEAERRTESERKKHAAELDRLHREIADRTPDSARYTIVDVVQVGPHLVVKAQYPNCARCSYEGTKVMVYLNTSPLDAMRWREIDPHFTDPKAVRKPTQAPGPAARFPASAEGWADAQTYARGKCP